MNLKSSFYVGIFPLIILTLTTIVPVFFLEEYTIEDQIYKDIVQPEGGNKITLDNKEIVHYYIEGPKDADLVIVTHGISVSGRLMLPLSRSIVKMGYRTITFDFYGRGHSSAPHQDYSETLLVNQTYDFLVALRDQNIINQQQYDKFNLVGFSLGGAVSVTFAAKYPERIASLILIAPAGLPFDVPLVAHIATLPIIGDILQYSNLGRLIFNMRAHGAYADPQQYIDHITEVHRLNHFHWQKDGFLRAFQSTLMHFPLNNCTDSYAKVGQEKFPVIIFWGTSDKTVPYSCSVAAQQLIKRAELVSLTKSGHNFMEEKDVIDQKLESFLHSVNNQ